MLKLEETIRYLEEMNGNLETPVIVVTGMHRSGTSLVASLLQSAGVNIGRRLMNAGEGNVKGHFEDLDFVDLHESILKSQGFSKQGWILQNGITVQEQYLSRTKEMIKTRQGNIWGWKDPRTTLFIDFWQEQIPNIFYIFIFRSPWEVIDSLYRRGDEVFLNNPNFALDVWVNYNKTIIDFHKKYSSSCCIFNIESIIKNHDFLIKILEDRFRIKLEKPEYCYDEFIFNRELNDSHRPAIIKDYFPEAWEIYDKLCLIDQQNHNFNHFDLSQLLGNIPEIKAWILQDWIDVKVNEKGFKKSQKEIESLEFKISVLQKELQEEKIKNEKLQNTIEENNYIITFMKESRFWKLRDFWFKLRRRLIPF